MNNKIIISFAVALIAVGGASFYGGMKYDQSKNRSPRDFVLNGQNGQRNFAGLGGNSAIRRGPGANGSFVNGQIIAKDDKSITVKSRDGGSKIVFLAPSTQVTEAVNADNTALTTGKDVVVNGTANPDGSITGQIIQIRLITPQASSTPPNN